MQKKTDFFLKKPQKSFSTNGQVIKAFPHPS